MQEREREIGEWAHRTAKTMLLSDLMAMRPGGAVSARIAAENPDVLNLILDLHSNGQGEPILVRDGRIVDGIHRLFALWLMGYQGGVSVEEWVSNVARSDC